MKKYRDWKNHSGQGGSCKIRGKVSNKTNPVGCERVREKGGDGDDDDDDVAMMMMLVVMRVTMRVMMKVVMMREILVMMVV